MGNGISEMVSRGDFQKNGISKIKMGGQYLGVGGQYLGVEWYLGVISKKKEWYLGVISKKRKRNGNGISE